MSAYLRKEIRLLLPSLGIALVLALTVWLVPTEPIPRHPALLYLLILPVLCCPALVVMMALDSFGREITAGTFAQLLAQPVPRPRVWWVKTSLLAAGMALVFGVWWLSFLLHHPNGFWTDTEEMRDTLVTTLLMVITAYSGGLWSVLFFRQVGVAFWATVIVPAFLALLVSYVTVLLGIHAAELCISLALILYSVAGFIWARRLFLGAQDAHWTGGQIVLPGKLNLARSLRPVSSTRRRPWTALLLKEVQLHQSQFVIAGVLAVVHLAVIIPWPFLAKLNPSGLLELGRSLFWTLWFFIPLLIGCEVVGEERRLGTWESQLCLPVRRWTQFLVKVGVALFLAICLGVGAPVLLEGGRILESFQIGQNRFAGQSGVPVLEHFAQTITGFLAAVFGPLLPFLPLALLALAFFAIALYASSLARNTLHAVGPAVLGALLVWLLIMAASEMGRLDPHPLWRGPLIYLIGIPVMSATLVGLTYRNFGCVRVNRQVWLTNLAVFTGALALTAGATTTLYQRAWELLTPLEPAHGPARIASTKDITVAHDWYHLTIRFADGRACVARLLFDAPTLGEVMLNNAQLEMVGGNCFLEGTNWASIAPCHYDVMALKTDGSLWVSEKPEYWRRTKRNGKPVQPEPLKLVRYGDQSGWKALAGHWNVAFALKRDGTLWSIGANRPSGNGPRPGLRDCVPHRLGNESDWAGLFSIGDQVAFQKSDGRTYLYPARSASQAELFEFSDDIRAERAPYLEEGHWRDTTRVWVYRGGLFQVGVNEDGGLAVVSDYESGAGNSNLATRDIQLGQATNWVAVAGDWGRPLVALKADGTLWAWEFPEYPIPVPKSLHPKQLGTHSDWRGIAGTVGGFVSLSADGGVWDWRFPAQYGSDELLQPLLRPSRKPKLMGNIFGKAE